MNALPRASLWDTAVHPGLLSHKGFTGKVAILTLPLACCEAPGKTLSSLSVSLPVCRTETAGLAHQVTVKVTLDHPREALHCPGEDVRSGVRLPRSHPGSISL